MNVDTWLHDPEDHDKHYALPKCGECGEEILEGETCPDCDVLQHALDCSPTDPPDLPPEKGVNYRGPTRAISFRIPHATLSQMDRVARALGINRTTLLRRALDHILTNGDVERMLKHRENAERWLG